MKIQSKFNAGIFTLAFAIISMVSCSDDDSNSGPSGSGNGNGNNIAAETISMKVDGTTQTFDEVFGISSFGSITLTGSDTTNSSFPQISISLSDTTIAGTYMMPAQGLYPSINFQKDTTSILFTTDGSLTITTHDVAKQQVIGTFDITMSQFGSSTKVNLTDGKFNVSY